MINKLKPKSEFSRNVLTLMTGTTIAQAIPIAISPILTRLYSPEDFGLFGLYMSMVTMLSVLTTGRYELAIMLPKKDEDAINLLMLSLIISVFVSIFFLIIILIFNQEITKVLGNPSISNWLYMIPISIFFIGIYQSFTLWHNRKKRYKDLAKTRVIQNGIMGIGNIGLGTVFTGVLGLIVGLLLGQILAIYKLIHTSTLYDKKIYSYVSSLKIKSLAKKYIKFPKYDILAAFSNVASQQVPHILFNALFSSTIAGYFYLTQRMMSMPVNLISSAVLDVFKEQAAKDYKKEGNASKIYIATFKKLFLLSIIPSVLIYIFSVDIFMIVFGEKWNIAGEYAQILVPMLFLRFISNPLSFMFYIGEKQKLNLLLQFLTLIGVLMSFYTADTAVEVVKYLAIVFSLFYIIQMYVSAKIAKAL